ncbi:hypothetical protein LAZ67_9000778 [Cordylochernes scorpioides]|uniref:Uncharacterized protein n=1 Tax=Cordylochernes scorpioides TaxID=51811 RepID=A0ABY6KSN1_9ARAC|nr:hypothetical protein LAZ67_9000778 [Cordylochernes scorpioides]
MHRPGIEPGAPAWQASILPLNQKQTVTELRTHDDDNCILSVTEAADEERRSANNPLYDESEDTTQKYIELDDSDSENYGEQKCPKRFSQPNLNDLTRDLRLSKQDAELLASRLKEISQLEEDVNTPLQSATRRALRRLRYSEARVAAAKTMQVPVQRIQLWTHKPFSGLQYNTHIDYTADSSVDIGQMSRSITLQKNYLTFPNIQID